MDFDRDRWVCAINHVVGGNKTRNGTEIYQTIGLGSLPTIPIPLLSSVDLLAKNIRCEVTQHKQKNFCAVVFVIYR